MPSSCLRARSGAYKKKARVSTRERKKDHTSRTRTFCRRATNNKIVQNGKKAPNASRRDRRSLGFCSLSFPAFSRAARGDLTLSFPRRFASGKFESEIPRHDHDITTTRPFLLRREKKRGRLSSSTRKRPRAFERRSSKRVSKRAKSSSKPTVGSPRFQNSNNEFRDTNFGRDDKNREKKRRRRRKLSRRTRSPVFLRDEHPLVLAVSVPLEHVREILDGFLRGLVEAQAAVRVRIDR